MSIFKKSRGAGSALGPDFCKKSDVKTLRSWQFELEQAIKDESRPRFERVMFKTRLDYVEQWLWQKSQDDRCWNKKPWEWPGPIAPVGMKARRNPDGTYAHVTTIDPEHQSEELQKGEQTKLLNWAERCGVDRTTAYAHLGGIRHMHKERFLRSELIELQERIAKIAAEKHEQKEANKKVGIFSKVKKVEPKPEKGITREEAEAQVFNEAKMLEIANARQRLEISPDAQILITGREDVDRVLRDRNLAALELALIIEQYESAKANLEQFINDIDLVYDDDLGKFLDKNNPTKKKSWELLHGTLKRANKPFTVSLDKDGDPDETRLQAELKRIYETDEDLAQKLGIEKRIKYSRDMKALQAHYKELKKKGVKYPAWAGVRVKEAKENVFSVAPSLDTIKKKISEDLKERGIK